MVSWLQLGFRNSYSGGLITVNVFRRKFPNVFCHPLKSTRITLHTTYKLSDGRESSGTTIHQISVHQVTVSNMTTRQAGGEELIGYQEVIGSRPRQYRQNQ